MTDPLPTDRTRTSPTHDPDELLTTGQAAYLLGVSESWLAKARVRGGDAPRYVRLTARRVAYRRKDLTTYVESRLRGSTSEN